MNSRSFGLHVPAPVRPGIVALALHQIIPDLLRPLPVHLAIDCSGRIVWPNPSLLLLQPRRPLVMVQPALPHLLIQLQLHYLGVCLLLFLLGSIYGLVGLLDLPMLQSDCLPLIGCLPARS